MNVCVHEEDVVFAISNLAKSLEGGTTLSRAASVHLRNAVREIETALCLLEQQREINDQRAQKAVPTW
jgi:hypothetical protein